jgi:hypothetical protein
MSPHDLGQHSRKPTNREWIRVGLGHESSRPGVARKNLFFVLGLVRIDRNRAAE